MDVATGVKEEHMDNNGHPAADAEDREGETEDAGVGGGWDVDIDADDEKQEDLEQVSMTLIVLSFRPRNRGMLD